MRTRSIVQSWTIYPFGCVEILLQKQILDDADNVISATPHRTAMNPDTDIDAQGQAVFAHLEAMGFPIEGDGWAQMKAQALAAREHPDAQAWLAAKAARIAGEN